MANTNSPKPPNDQSYDYPNAIDPTLASSLQSKALGGIFDGADPRGTSTTASPYPSGVTGENNPRALPPFARFVQVFFPGRMHALIWVVQQNDLD